MSTTHERLKFFRKIHLYFGIFITPALLFFAFTGALQTFSLHETTQGSNYKPPAWATKLAQLHKKQTLTLPAHHPRPHDAAAPDAGTASPKTHTAAAAADTPPQPQPKSHLPMKLFFLTVAIGLFTSTLTGLYMAYKYERRTWLVHALLLGGLATPLLLLKF